IPVPKSSHSDKQSCRPSQPTAFPPPVKRYLGFHTFTRKREINKKMKKSTSAPQTPTNTGVGTRAIIPASRRLLPPDG
ncbi:hypothetical protein, partial [Roseinatronobacter sp.]